MSNGQSQPTPYGLGTSPTDILHMKLPGPILPMLFNVRFSVLSQSPSGVEVSHVFVEDQEGQGYSETDLFTLQSGESGGYRLPEYLDVTPFPFHGLKFKAAGAGAALKITELQWIGSGQVFGREASPYWEAADELIDHFYLMNNGLPSPTIPLFRGWVCVYGHYNIG